MTRLSAAAREEIKCSGLTIAAYTRNWWVDGRWHGDRCGCTDDRCIGFHHDENEDCGCLPVLIGDVLRERAAAKDAAIAELFGVDRAS